MQFIGRNNCEVGLSPQLAQQVRDALESAGCRFTRQRAAVFAYLDQVKSHPTADEVYQAVRRSIPRISLATVYKSLEALVSAGLAAKLTNGDGSARYDCAGADHYHLRDTATGEIMDDTEEPGQQTGSPGEPVSTGAPDERRGQER